MRPLAVVFVLLAVAMAAPHAQSKPQATVKGLQEQLEVIGGWLSELDARTATVNPQVDCNTGGFQMVTIAGVPLTFLASCTKIEPFLEGYRLTLNIGNLYAMEFDGFSGVLGYGDSSLKSYTQSVEFSMTTPIRAGTWSTLTIVVSPAAAKDVRFIRLKKLTLRTVSHLIDPQ